MTYSEIWNTAHVPTLSVYTALLDGSVQPLPAVATLNGKGKQIVSSIQSLCGTAVVDHYLMLVAHPAFAMTASFLANGTVPSAAEFNPARCYTYPDGTITDFRSVAGLVKAIVADIFVVATGYKAQGEPKFPSYVCEAGAAAASECGEGYFPISLVP